MRCHTPPPPHPPISVAQAPWHHQTQHHLPCIKKQWCHRPSNGPLGVLRRVREALIRLSYSSLLWGRYRGGAVVKSEDWLLQEDYYCSALAWHHQTNWHLRMGLELGSFFDSRGATSVVAKQNAFVQSGIHLGSNRAMGRVTHRQMLVHLFLCLFEKIYQPVHCGDIQETPPPLISQNAFRQMVSIGSTSLKMDGLVSREIKEKGPEPMNQINFIQHEWTLLDF